MQEWIAISSTIGTLFQAGILRDPTAEPPKLSSRAMQFDNATEHLRMLADRTRTEAYMRALREVVRPDDVVVDIGTGTGVLAMMAAQAGARHVYAVEVSSISQVAQRLFEANGLADRITLVEGLSTRIELPERATVLVSELIGREPLGEHVLEVTKDAVRRLLTPDARLIPQMLRVFGIPVSLPEWIVSQFEFSEAGLAEWREWYGIDFRRLAEAAPRGTTRLAYKSSRRVREWERVAPPVELLNVALKTNQDLAFARTREFEVVRGGRLDAVVLYFDLGLTDAVSFSTDPEHAAETNSWPHTVVLLGEPLTVEAGETVAMTLRHRLPGPMVSCARAARPAPVDG
jgi:SAM-dependent methyltransferase